MEAVAATTTTTRSFDDGDDDGDVATTKSTTPICTTLPIDLIVDQISSLLCNRKDWNNLSLVNHEIYRKLQYQKQNAPWPTGDTIDGGDAAAGGGAVVLDVGRNIIPNEPPYRGQPFEIRCMAVSSSSSPSIGKSARRASTTTYEFDSGNESAGSTTTADNTVQEDYVACACNDGNIRLWNRQSGRRMILPGNHRIDQISFLVLPKEGTDVDLDSNNDNKQNRIQLVSSGISPQILVYDIYQLEIGSGGSHRGRDEKQRKRNTTTTTTTTPITKCIPFHLGNDFVGRTPRFVISPDGKRLITAAYHRPSRLNHIIIYEYNQNNTNKNIEGSSNIKHTSSSNSNIPSSTSPSSSTNDNNRIIRQFHHSGSSLLKLSPFQNGRYLASTKHDQVTVILWDLLQLLPGQEETSSAQGSDFCNHQTNQSSSLSPQLTEPPHILLKGHKKRVWMIAFGSVCSRSTRRMAAEEGCDQYSVDQRTVVDDASSGLLASVDCGDNVLVWSIKHTGATATAATSSADFACIGFVPSSSRNSVGAIVFGPNGKYLAVSRDDGTIEFWSTTAVLVMKDSSSVSPLPLILIATLPPPFRKAKEVFNDNHEPSRPNSSGAARREQRQNVERGSTSYFIDLAITNDGRTIFAADCETGHLYLQRIPNIVRDW